MACKFTLLVYISADKFEQVVLPSISMTTSEKNSDRRLGDLESLAFPYLTTRGDDVLTREYVEETIEGRRPPSDPKEYSIASGLQTKRSEHSLKDKSKELEIITWKIEDPENPHNWNRVLKWYITIAAAFSVVSAAFGSAVATGDFEGVMDEFGVSLEVASLTVTLMVCGFGIGPLLWSPLSELVGRRPIWIFAYGLYIIFNIPCALTPNIGGLLIGRFLSGFFGAVPLTLAGGAIADVWDQSERGFAVALFAAAPVSIAITCHYTLLTFTIKYGGPVLGPLIGGFVGEALGWRWLYWINMIFAALSWVMITIVPETYGPAILKQRAQKLRHENIEQIYTEQELNKASIREIAYSTLMKPFLMLASEPILLLMSMYIAWIYGCLYAFFFSFPVVYHDPLPKGYGYSNSKTGLTFIPVLIGVALAIVVTPILERQYSRTVMKRSGCATPEDRLPGMMIGVLFVPVALFIFGWTAPPSVEPTTRAAWVGPCSAGIPFGLGMVIVYFAANAYLIDAFPKAVASALAAKTVVRSGAGAAMPLFITPMFHRLGNGWASSLFGFISIVMAPIPFVFYRWGPMLRAKSKNS